jgi:hypothetical protein
MASSEAAADTKKIPNDAIFCLYTDDEDPRAFASLRQVCFTAHSVNTIVPENDKLSTNKIIFRYR